MISVCETIKAASVALNDKELRSKASLVLYPKKKAQARVER